MKKSDNIRLIFFGGSKYVLPIIQALKSTKLRFNLGLVVTGRNSDDIISSYCTKNKIPYLSIKQFNNLTIQAIKDADASVAVLANFGILISKDVLSIFPHGIINIHPSLLPKYRGSTPVQAAILNGDKTTGVTLIKLDDQIDHGPILAQISEPILSDDTSENLYKRLFKIGADLIEQDLEKYLEGQINLKEQDHSKATFTKALTRNDGYFDVNNSPAAEILNRMIRAYFSWPGAWTKLRFVRDSTPGVDAQKIIKLLPDGQIQVEGKKPMSYKDFINGYREGKEILEKLELI